jgi:Na+-driven multidrug efflux pump
MVRVFTKWVNCPGRGSFAHRDYDIDMSNTTSVKYRLIYQITAASPVLFGLISTVLTIKFFGTSKPADAYLGAVAITTTLGVITIMPFDQFLHFYNDQDVKSSAVAREFYSSAFTLSLVAGLVFGVLCYGFAPQLVSLFYSDFDPAVKATASEILRISLVAPVLVPVLYVIRCLLNARQLYLLPYVIGGLPSLFTVLAFGVMYVTSTIGVKYLAYASSLGNLIALAGYLVVLQRHKLLPSLKFDFRILWAMVKNSTMIRLSGNIYTVLLSLVVTKYLSGFDSGVVSAYFYADKAVNSAIMVSSGPVQNIYVANVSRLWYEKKFDQIAGATAKYLRSGMLYFVVTLALVYVAIPFAFDVINSARVGKTDISLIVSFFILLSLWKLVVLVESPFVIIPQAAKVSWIFFIGNGAYIVFLFLLGEVFHQSQGALGIAVAGIIAQLSNLGIYYWYTRQMMSKLLPLKPAAG